MKMKSVLDFVRELDFFAIPVQLTYKGNKEFNSAIGGLCSILFCLAVVIAMAVRINEIKVNPTYKLVY